MRKFSPSTALVRQRSSPLALVLGEVLVGPPESPHFRGGRRSLQFSRLVTRLEASGLTAAISSVLPVQKH